MHFLGWGRKAILERITSPPTHIQVFILVQFVLTETPTHTETVSQCPPTLAEYTCARTLACAALFSARVAAHGERSARVCFSREQLLLIY